MYFPLDDTYYYAIQVYSNEIFGEKLTFKYYDNTNDEVIEYSETLTFENNMIVGDCFHAFGLSRIMPKEFALSPAYPNPFNPVTNITFGLENDAMVVASIYDITGREVAEITNGILLQGYHSVDWNADNHSSGLYFLTIKVNEVAGSEKQIVKTQKLMLMK